MTLDRIGFCDTCCCEDVKKSCWFTCYLLLKCRHWQQHLPVLFLFLPTLPSRKDTVWVQSASVCSKTCFFSIAIADLWCSGCHRWSLSDGPCLHPAGHPELTGEHVEKPRLFEGAVNLVQFRCLQGTIPSKHLFPWTPKGNGGLLARLEGPEVWWDRSHPLSEPRSG